MPGRPMIRRGYAVSFSSDRRRWAMRVLPLGIVLILVLPGNGYAHPSAPPTDHPVVGGRLAPVAASRIGPAATAPYNSTLTVNTSAINLSSTFFGATVNNEVHMFRGETNAVNATPSRVLVWPGAIAGEDYDPLSETHYDQNGGPPIHALTNEPQFVALCRAIHCTAIVQVPAEIDDPSIAEAIVNYTEVNLSFTPAYWMIGNEPELWDHWKVPWKDWTNTFTGGPTPTQFGNEVVTYVKAIRAVDNTTPILGLPASGCTCGSWTFEQWISGVLKVTGPMIQAVAFHEYPAGWLGTGDGSLLDFYATIQGPASIPVRMAGARAAVTSSCPQCNVSVFISELGSALSWSAYGQYAIGFSGSLSLASQITQAMDDNLTNIDLFAAELATTNSWFNPTGGPRADYTLYTQIFDHLGTQAFPVNLSGLGHSLYGIDTLAPADQGRQDLLVVNDNITHPISFTPKFAGEYEGAATEAWSWNGTIYNTPQNGTTWVEPSTVAPVPQEFPNGLPSTYILPPQSMVLFESYPSGGTYVHVNATGVPAATPWYVSLGSQLHTTTTQNLSLLLPAGTYSTGSVGIPLPLGGKERVPDEQLGPYVDSPVEIDGASTNVTVHYVSQWRINATADPGVGGTVLPAVGWANASAPLNLSAASAPGYAFAGWSGWGPGSYNGTNRSITVVPTGRITEKARFVVGQEIDLVEYGLPAHTNWSITVRGLTLWSTSSEITVYEPAGSYGFSVDPVPGYRTLPANGGFTVNSPWRQVPVQFFPIHPPGPEFPVTFDFSGLPAATAVSITVRNATESTGAYNPQFLLLNGSYAYRVGIIPGYHPAVAEKTFAVSGGPVTVVIPFVPTVYKATWTAVGARYGMNWSIELNGGPLVATSSWASTSLANGSYSYAIRAPPNFTAVPRTGTLQVAGFATKLYLVFQLVEFPTWFEASGSGPNSAWSVRLGNLTQSASSTTTSFMAANGTYTFDVHPPAGYYAVPSHGTLTVRGSSTSPLEVRFLPTSERPSAALVASLSSGALSVAVWIGASIGVGFGVVYGLRRRSG